jgi:hypothetical protein
LRSREICTSIELHQLVARQRLPRVLHQHLEHREFPGGERNLLAVAREAARGEIEIERAEAVDFGFRGGPARRPGGLAPPQYRVDPGDQLARIEGLGKVVVGAHLQADDAVHLVALGGEHHDRGPVVPLGGISPPEAAADREPVLARKHEIEHHQVVALARELPVHAR